MVVGNASPNYINCKMIMLDVVCWLSYIKIVLHLYVYAVYSFLHCPVALTDQIE
jgi:hypothetical protein